MSSCSVIKPWIKFMNNTFKTDDCKQPGQKPSQPCHQQYHENYETLSTKWACASCCHLRFQANHIENLKITKFYFNKSSSTSVYAHPAFTSADTTSKSKQTQC